MGLSLHVLILRTLKQLVNMSEKLVFGDLVFEALEDFLDRSKVGLNLVLDILVHAQLLFGSFAAAHEALDPAHVDGSKFSLDNFLLIKFSREVGGHLIAGINDLFISILEPGTWHVVLLSILLHGADINFVLCVEDVHLSEDTGHVSDLGLLLLKHSLNLLLESVIKSQGIIISLSL